MKKALAFLLAATILAGAFTGCAQTGPQESSSAPQSGSTAEDGPVVLTFWRSTTTDYYIDEDNETFQKLHEKALKEGNVDLQIEYYDYGDNYKQKMTMYAAAGDLPSGVWLMGGVSDPFATEIINKMGMNGQLHDWSEVVYDKENYPTLEENAGDTFLKMATCKEDGKLYGFPAETHKAYPHAAGGISLRKDWLKEAGLQFPKNETDLYNVIKTFSENYKSDAGKEITPVSFPQWDNFTFWLNSWLGTSMWYEEDGKWNYGKYAKQDQLEAAAVFMNRLWNEGLMDKESFTHTNEQYITKGANGSFGVSTFSYVTTANINDAFYAKNPDSDQFIVSCPTFSCYDKLPADQVNSVEITSMPFNRVVVTTAGIDDAYFKRLAKAIDWIGTYDASLMLLMGFEGEDWEFNEKEDRKVRTQAWTDKITENVAYQYNAGLCFWSSLNSNAKAMFDLLNCICVRKSDVESVGNIKGHQVAVTDPMNIVSAGETEGAKMTLIDDAWKQMIIAAISAPSEQECRNVVASWPQTLKDMGYDEIVKERMETCKGFGLDIS